MLQVIHHPLNQECPIAVGTTSSGALFCSFIDFYSSDFLEDQKTALKTFSGKYSMTFTTIKNQDWEDGGR